MIELGNGQREQSHDFAARISFAADSDGAARQLPNDLAQVRLWTATSHSHPSRYPPWTLRMAFSAVLREPQSHSARTGLMVGRDGAHTRRARCAEGASR